VDSNRDVAEATQPRNENPQNNGVNRRRFLGGMVGGGAALLTSASALSLITLGTGGSAAAATTALTVPPLLTPTTTDGVDVYSLDMQTGTHQVLSGVTSSSAGFNGSYLGPTIKVANGDNVRIDVTNHLGEDTTVHWHGAHVPAKVDGGPQVAISNGETWSPEFTVNQEACTLWYHPHALGTTSKQVSQGLAAMLIVDDDSAASAALPSDYGIDDIPVILQCLASDTSGGVKYDAAGYSQQGLVYPLLVNGVNADTTTFSFNATKPRIRFRFLNASLSDIITIKRGDGGTLTQVATEQAYLNTATEVTTIRLVAGSRAEVVVNAADAPLIQAVVTTGWIRGGSGTYPILQVTDGSSGSAGSLPSTLNTITRYSTAAFTARTVRLSNSGATMLINGVAGTTMAAMETNMIMTTVGSKEIWTIVNATQLEHSFHVHDVPFQLISVNGTAVTGVDLGWKDTVEVIGGGTVVIAMEFTDYADSEYMYMLHCHIVQHEDEGMMAGLMVT
jgi:FtsP/CotA-like multicopper oxidase with cupredoxin domain